MRIRVARVRTKIRQRMVMPPLISRGGEPRTLDEHRAKALMDYWDRKISAYAQTHGVSSAATHFKVSIEAVQAAIKGRLQ